MMRMTSVAGTALMGGLLLVAIGLTAAAGKDGEAHWGYEGAEGPDNWGKSFPMCGLGTSQSPIDITGPYKKATEPITVRYRKSALKVVNNGHTIQVNYDPGSFMKIGKVRYELLQFHFHRPSEEKLSGKAKPMVAHFVHKSAKGKLAVIGVLIDEGKENPLIASIWANLPQETGKVLVAGKTTIDATRLLPASLAYYHFMGSLTTPPCSEEVAFYILKNTVQVSRPQIEAFPFRMNARPVQPLNGREIAESGN